MSFSPSADSLLSLQENPFEYNVSPRSGLIYEVSLRVRNSTDWLKDLQAAHRLVQVLLQGQLLGQYELLDFLIWPEGLFARVLLSKTTSLSNFLRFLKEKSSPVEQASSAYWDDELQWIKLISRENLEASNQAFLETANRIQQDLKLSQNSPSSLLFLYRNSSLPE